MASSNNSTTQQRIYAFILRSLQTRELSPSIPEIARAFQVSTALVEHHLLQLERAGAIARPPGKHRSIIPKRAIGMHVDGYLADGQPLDLITEEAWAAEVAPERLALMVQGNGFCEEHICHGDYVICTPQAPCQNGDLIIAIHRQAGGIATLKRLFREQTQVALHAVASLHPPIVLPIEVWENEWQRPWKVVALIRVCG